MLIELKECIEIKMTDNGFVSGSTDLAMLNPEMKQKLIMILKGFISEMEATETITAKEDVIRLSLWYHPVTEETTGNINNKL